LVRHARDSSGANLLALLWAIRAMTKTASAPALDRRDEVAETARQITNVDGRT
jgi:hypothetical protein